MFENSLFQELVAKGKATGEVIGSDRFLITVKGLDGVAIDAQVLFESGQVGIVREVTPEAAIVLNISSENVGVGELVVIRDNAYRVPVGEGVIGRVITPLGHALDGKGPIHYTHEWPVFNRAPSIMERSILNDPLPTGVTVVDMLFPFVLGQRIAVLGDTKSGKSSFLLQTGVNQASTDRVVVYVLIGKRQVEIEQTLRMLNDTGAMKNSIVIVANIFDSLTQTYLAPYVGCSIAEHLWYGGKDVVIVYDDLTSHAKVYREISLLSHGNPGRDSYPGDMFYVHSSLLERAGKLASNGKTLTALPAMLTPGDDITAYLPTSVMSITDGQIIFDLNTFRQDIRPAVNVGLSVSRVGGRAQTARQKTLSTTLFKRLADYRQAAEFAHYGADLTQESQQALQLGRLLQDVFHQSPTELYSPLEQQLMVETVVLSAGQYTLNIGLLRQHAKEMAPSVKSEADIEGIVQQLLATVTMGEAVR